VKVGLPTKKVGDDRKLDHGSSNLPLGTKHR